MSSLRRFSPVSPCAFGFHQVPPPRDPPGPVVAFCPCCHKAMYCYGINHAAVNIYPTLMLSTFPRVLGPICASQPVFLTA